MEVLRQLVFEMCFTVYHDPPIQREPTRAQGADMRDGKGDRAHTHTHVHITQQHGAVMHSGRHWLKALLGDSAGRRLRAQSGRVFRSSFRLLGDRLTDAHTITQPQHNVPKTTTCPPIPPHASSACSATLTDVHAPAWIIRSPRRISFLAWPTATSHIR